MGFAYLVVFSVVALMWWRDYKHLFVAESESYAEYQEIVQEARRLYNPDGYYADLCEDYCSSCSCCPDCEDYCSCCSCCAD